MRVVEQTNSESFPGAGLHVVRRGSGATVVALGPVLDEVLEATAGRDVTVLYAHSVRPFDARTFRSVLASPDVVLVEPWLAGTSARCVADALVDVPHRLLALGTRRTELRHYGTPGRAPARPRPRRRRDPALARRVPGCVIGRAALVRLARPLADVAARRCSSDGRALLL